MSSSIALSCLGIDGTQFTAGSAVFNIRCGRDWTAGDLKKVKTTSFQNCMTACATTDGCGQAVWSPKQQWCYLKGTLNAYTQDARVWGAILASVEADPTCLNNQSQGRVYTVVSGGSYAISCGADYSGGDLSSFPTTSFKTCLATCDTTPGCVGAAFYKRSICYLKQRMGTQITNTVVWAAKKVNIATSSLTTSTRAATTLTTSTTSANGITTIPSSDATTVAAPADSTSTASSSPSDTGATSSLISTFDSTTSTIGSAMSDTSATSTVSSASEATPTSIVSHSSEISTTTTESATSAQVSTTTTSIEPTTTTTTTTSTTTTITTTAPPTTTTSTTTATTTTTATGPTCTPGPHTYSPTQQYLKQCDTAYLTKVTYLDITPNIPSLEACIARCATKPGCTVAGWIRAETPQNPGTTRVCALANRILTNGQPSPGQVYVGMDSAILVTT